MQQIELAQHNKIRSIFVTRHCLALGIIASKKLC